MAVKVTACRRFYIEFPHIRETRMQDQVPFPLIEPIFGVGGDVSTLEKDLG